MQYSVYRRATGEIERHVTCPPGKVGRAFRLNEAEFGWVEGHHDAGAWLVVNGELVSRPPQPPAPVEPHEIKAEARRRILSIWPEWRQINVLAGGDTETQARMRAEIDAIRAASNRIEAMEPIPQDYRDDRLWPKQETTDERNA